MKLYFHVTGHGPALMILHGLFGSGDNWYTLSNFFASHFRVYAIDQRNHGRSPHSDVFDYNVMADDLNNLMIHEGITSACLLGHSMGGKTAMTFALAHPDKVDRLVVVDIGPKAYPPKHDRIFQALFALDLKKYKTRSELDAALAEHIAEYPVRQLLLKNVSREQDGTFAWKIDVRSIHRNYDKVNEEISSPTSFSRPVLFVKGERSSYILDEDVPSIKRIFTRARILVIPGAGHWVHAEAPGAFGESVMEFLTSP